jgi:hypothetical protein
MVGATVIGSVRIVVMSSIYPAENVSAALRIPAIPLPLHTPAHARPSPSAVSDPDSRANASLARFVIVNQVSYHLRSTISPLLCIWSY